MTRRLIWMVVALLAVAALLAGVKITGSSSATYVSSSTSNGTVSAAADWTPPTVAVTQPASVVKGAITVAATATDTTSGIASVTIQGAPAGTSTWTTICVDTTSPYSCSFNASLAPDGPYDLRATAVDTFGNSATSATVRTIVANTLTVTLITPAAGSIVTGSLDTSSTISNAGTVAPSVRVEYAPTGTTTWTTLCTSAASPHACSATIPNGTYDLRSVATSGTADYTSAAVTGVIVDNLAPAVTMTDPGTGLKGTKTFGATATDTHSGVAKVVVQATTTTVWSEVCTITSAPFTCSFDTNSLPNGTYSFRAVATDKAGNTTTSAAVTNRSVANVVTTVSLTAPSATLKGAVTLSATATSTGTLASVKIQRSPASANAWTDICTDTSSPYSCSFATTGVADGAYDLRAVATDSTGATTTSTVVTNRVVDNPPRGIDIQTTNGSGVNGRVDAGDTIVYTFSEQVNLSSIHSGWSGDATSGTLKIKGGFFSTDTFDITGPSNSAVRLGTVDLNADFALWLVDSSASVSISAARDSLGRTVVTVSILSTAINGLRSTDATALIWNPSSSVIDMTGNAMSTDSVTESGDPDVDF
jgi:chitinase